MIVDGICSGDLECFCLLVSKEDFVRVKGSKPNKFDVGRFAKRGSPYRYKLYPGDLIGYNNDQKLITLKVEVEEKKLP